MNGTGSAGWSSLGRYGVGGNWSRANFGNWSRSMKYGYSKFGNWSRYGNYSRYGAYRRNNVTWSYNPAWRKNMTVGNPIPATKSPQKANEMDLAPAHVPKDFHTYGKGGELNKDLQGPAVVQLRPHIRYYITPL